MRVGCLLQFADIAGVHEHGKQGHHLDDLLPLLLMPQLRPATLIPHALLLPAQFLLTVRLLKRLKRPCCLMFAVMSLVRAYGRGVGMMQGVFAYLFGR